MKELPIIFQTEMVKAILDGRKTQTRRVVKPQPDRESEGVTYMPTAPALDWEQYYNEVWKPWHWETADGESIAKFCPYGQPGDLLYVRETWCRGIDYSEIGNDRPAYLYRADYISGDDYTWLPSIHLPKEASRIWLKVADVRVERLQEISEEDALREGIDASKLSGDWEHSPSQEFWELWKRINGIASYDANPFVWVISFEVISTTGKPKTISNLLTTTP